jgi:HEPN domain-containing protein
MKPHEEWLFKAEHDIKSADLLLKGQEPLYDVAIYHAQQCAEKSLKSFLAFREKEISKIHNLLILLEECVEIDSRFNEIYEDCIYLNPYATLYRYPEGDLMPERDEVESAIHKAKKVMNFVGIKINIS